MPLVLNWGALGRMVLLVLACMPACGRFAFDPLDDHGDASGEQGLGPFGAPVELPQIDTTSAEDDPAITADQLEMYFDSDRPGTLGNEDLYRSVRASIDDPWGPPEQVLALSTASADLAPGIDADGLTIYWSTNSGTGNGLDIYMATRPDRAAAWSAPMNVAELSSAGEDTNPQTSSDGLEMWLCSRRAGQTARQLYRSTRTSRDLPWSIPVAVDALNVGPDTYTGDAWPSPDGRWLYFSSARPGGEGATDLWVVERSSPTTFATPVPLAELNDGSGQHDPWLTADLRTIYFSTKVAGSTAIVMSTR